MVALTSRAASQIRTLIQSQASTGWGLRVQVVGGGCSGFLYDLALACNPEATDRVFESEGLRIFVDGRALHILEGTLIDYKDTDYGEGFVFANPRATKACSCGASFSA